MASSELPSSDLAPPGGDRFAIERQVGGDNSSVWKALDLKNDQNVALKRLRPDLADSRELMSRLKRDIKTFSKLKHAGFVQVLELDQDEHGPLLVLEWIEGWTLAELAHQSGPLSEQRTVKVIAQIADTLHAAHEKKIAHRNIKPSNILFTSNKKAKLTDCGLRRVDVESLQDAPGDIDCVAPELLANPRDVSPQSDIWSLGATLYQLITGWSAREFEASLLPESYRDAVVCALADDPAARFSDAAALGAALRGDRSQLDSRELNAPEPRSLKSADEAQTETESDTQGNRKRTRVRFGKPTTADDMQPEDGAGAGRVTKRRRPQKPAGETEETTESATEPDEDNAPPSKSGKRMRVRLGRPARGDEDAEDGADAGRVTRSRRPLKPDEETSEPEQEQPPPPDAEDESARPEPQSRSRFSVRFGRPAGDEDVEGGADAGRVSRTRRPLKPDEAAAVEQESQDEPVEASNPSEPKPKGRMRVRLGRPAGRDEDAEEGADAGRVTRSRRPLKPEEESGDEQPAEADAPPAKLSRGMKVRFGRSGTDEDAEDGADAGRVSRSRRPLKPEEEARYDHSTGNSEDASPAESGSKTRVRLGKPADNDDSSEVSATSRRATKSDQTTKSGGVAAAEAAAEDGPAELSEDKAPPVRRSSPSAQEVEKPVRRQPTRSDEGTDDETLDDDRTSVGTRRRKSNPVETDDGGHVHGSGHSTELADSDASAGDQTEAMGRRRRRKPDADRPGRQAAASQSLSVGTDATQSDEAGRSQQTKKASNTMVAVWGGVLVVMVAIIIALNSSGGHRPDGNQQTVNLNQGGSSATIGEATDAGEEFAGTEIQIGPNGQFKSIAPCLDYLRRNSSRYSTNARGQNVELIVRGEKTYGPIVIDNTTGEFPDGIHIVAGPGPRPTLTAEEGPVVQLKNAKSFRLEGFDIDAKESDIAMTIRGNVIGTRLVGLAVHGFRECGLELTAATGEVADELVVRLSQFTPGESTAVGVRLQAGRNVIPARTHVSECRFNGPMKTGIELDGGCEFVELRQNIIDQPEVGISLTGKDVDWKELLIANTTFYEGTQAGIRISHTPKTGGIRGTQLAICRNVFAKVDGPELVFGAEFERERFDEMISTVEGAGIRDNWSDRPTEPDANAGEFEIIERESGSPARRVESIEFHTTERTRSDFLMLPRGTPLYIGGTGSLGMQAWVGARPPILD